MDPRNKTAVFRNRRHLTAAVLFAAILLVSVFSSLYIAREAEHSCTGADCSICLYLQQCESQLNQLGAGKAAEGAVVPVLLLAVALVALAFSAGSSPTLVSQKVRLDN